jgi:hypothetical protein
MAKPGKSTPPKPTDDKPSKLTPSAPPSENGDDYEDGDMATPKRDRYGDDDEPL